MLHVTNGSVVLSRIHALGLGGNVVPWDDVLHDGPVPQGLDARALRAVRARFLADGRAGEVDEIERSLASRDRALESARTEDETVLWFEHDLYDQLQVLQILDRLATLPGRGRVTALLANDYLGAQADAQLRAWFQSRRELTSVEWQAAAEAWRLFRSPDPTELSRFTHDGAWPALRSSLHRHLQQFPSVRTGLSRTETQTLAALAGGPKTPRDLYPAANHAVEEAVFLGDWGWWGHVKGLTAGPHPLLRVEGGGDRAGILWRDDESAPRIAITSDGERVLAGQADRIALNGIDRWLGGVHLQGREGVWRWNEGEARIART